MNYQQYPTYKPSNIEWVGKIPKEWEMKKMKFISKINTGGKNTVDYEDDGEYPFFVRSDNIERISTYSYDGEAILTAGDGVGVGKVFHYFNGKFDYHQRVYKVSNFPKNIFGKFVYYYFSNNFENEILRYNAKSTVDSIRYWMLSGFPITIPPLQTQQKISNYLDTQTTQINTLISKDEKLIELLKQKRVSLINEVVTKGLDKNVEMKDSGVEWIGKIPKNWEVRKLKGVVEYTIGGTPPSGNEKFFGGDNVWITIGDMEDWKYLDDSKTKLTNSGIYESNIKKVKKGSLLYSFKLSVGTISFAGCDLYTNEAIVSFIESKSLNLKFFGYSIKSYLIYNSNENIYGAKIMNQDVIKNSSVLIPPLQTQHTISNYLDKETSKIDSTISKIQKRIELYKERKQSLIHHIVTGKIMV